MQLEGLKSWVGRGHSFVGYVKWKDALSGIMRRASVKGTITKRDAQK